MPLRNLTIRLIAAYAALMTILALAGAPVWHLADWYALRLLAGVPAAGSFDDRVVLYDAKNYDVNDVRPLRRTLTAFLRRATRLPKAFQPESVVLDFWFARDQSTASGSFRDALSAAEKAGINVYAAVNPPIKQSMGEDEIGIGNIGRFKDEESQRDTGIYSLVSTGHTTFDEVEGPNILTFRACLRYPTDFGMRQILSLVLLATDRAPPDCNRDVVTLLIDPRAVIPSSSLHSLDETGTFSEFDVAKKTVVIGTLEHDNGDYAPMTNPEVVAWALSSEYQPATIANVRPVSVLMPVPVLGAAAVTVSAYLAMFMLIARRPSRKRLALTWRAAIAAAIVAGTLLIVVEAIFAHLGTVQPQVSAPLASAVVSAALCGTWGNAWMLNQIRVLAPSNLTTRVYDYDVFISYAHEEYEWVVENVYTPLFNIDKPRRLKIFFDRDDKRKSIEVSDYWMDTIALSILGSRFVVPIYSEVYFARAYCLYELRRAHRRQNDSALSWTGILPIMRGNAIIPEPFDDVEAAVTVANPTFMDQLIARLLSDLGKAEGGAD